MSTSIPLLHWKIQKAELVLFIRKQHSRKKKNPMGPATKGFDLQEKDGIPRPVSEMGHKKEIQSAPPKVQPPQRLAGLTLPFAICLVSSKHIARSDNCTAARVGTHRPTRPC